YQTLVHDRNLTVCTVGKSHDGAMSALYSSLSKVTPVHAVCRVLLVDTTHEGHHTMTNKLRWKFLNNVDGTIASNYNQSFTWVVGEWRHVQGTIRACGNGLHASKRITEALGYVQGDVLARVEVKGESDERDDKSAHQSMRIVKAYRWTKLDSVALAVYVAELVIDNFESARPGDDRPRKAIESAKAYLADPNAAAYPPAAYPSAAAYTASAAYSAYTAAAAAAANSAYAAANAAKAAANSAYAAPTAAKAAANAAKAAANASDTNKINAWLNARVSQLEEITA